MLKGSGHAPHVRDPVVVNRLIRDFALGSRPPPRRWTRASLRRKRALVVSSPIGLGHAWRDVAILRELRRLHPELEVDWLAQHPVTTVLEACGERIHPISSGLANESAHIRAESRGHDLHCFQALRRMDEILLANFMLFHDLVREEAYDLWIGDEAWEVDYYLHENPELKSAPYVWLSDFVGYLPMPDGGARERTLTADYNLEMIRHIERWPRVRDRAIFIGEPDDIVPEAFGPGLPAIRAWTEAHFGFSGYVLGSPPLPAEARPALRRELGYGEDERVCVVTVGGSGVGGDLLRRVLAAAPLARSREPRLRFVMAAGPRIDPASLPEVEGVTLHGYVHELHRHLAVCDAAIVQGGLATTMELRANARPFVYVPLGHHFEQQYHVHHRLARAGAGARLDFETATPEAIADGLATALGRGGAAAPVPDGGAARAAAMIAELL
jgi:predicted glycosyltransferase